MVVFMKENGRMMKKMDLDFFKYLMGEKIQDSLNKENLMEKEYSKPKEKHKKDILKMENL